MISHGSFEDLHAALSKIFMTGLARPYRPVRKLMLDGCDRDHGDVSKRRFHGSRQGGARYRHLLFIVSAH